MEIGTARAAHRSESNDVESLLGISPINKQNKLLFGVSTKSIYFNPNHGSCCWVHHQLGKLYHQLQCNMRVTQLKVKLSPKCNQGFICDWICVKPSGKCIIMMKEALLRFTVVSFSGTLIWTFIHNVKWACKDILNIGVSIWHHQATFGACASYIYLFVVTVDNTGQVKYFHQYQ